MQKYIIGLLFFTTCCLLLWQCANTNTSNNPYLNTDTTKAHYVGMETCRKCHENIYQTYIQTGMGQSWGLASKQKSIGYFSVSKALVYDTALDFYYKPYFENDSMYIMEFRLQGKDTVHKRIEKISYIVGSGQHTNSHIINTNGYLHQAPITFYAQKHQWDLAPGFERGGSSRFDRKIELECITCHNGYPSFVQESLNKYNEVKLGIDCERCHGPGSLHAEGNLAGKFYDTSKGPDYRIVNPKHLSTELQNSLCQRCHLQGVSVLNDDKTFFDFLPSTELKKVENIFLPNISGNKNGMIMASHVERMKMSNCFLQSKQMSCITCHNPHVSVKFTPIEQYNTACKSCHSANNNCTENITNRNAKQDNCSGCHMHKNSSIDIPHVAVTDHYIRKKHIVENADEIEKFLGMTCYNNNDVDNRTKARGYLEFYERYQPSAQLLDSARNFLASDKSKKNIDEDEIRLLFLKNDFEKIASISSTIKNEITIKDAWTCYRMGESLQKIKKPQEAIRFYKQAVTLKKYALDFQYKYATCFNDLKDNVSSKQILNFILSENKNYTDAYSLLGYIAMQENKMEEAKQFLQKAIELNPDKVQTLINLSVIHYNLHDLNKIKPLLLHANKLEPNNTQVQQMLNDIK
jgi:tetratricopeptide (TPR) repeat protein